MVVPPADEGGGPGLTSTFVFAGVLLAEEEDDAMSYDWMVEGIPSACEIKGAQ